MEEHQFDVNKLTNHLFRHESGKMVSVLTRLFGTQNIELAEDVVQQTFVEAIQIWPLKGIPANPSAWLYRVAKNKTIDILRRNRKEELFDMDSEQQVLFRSEYTLGNAVDSLWDESEIKDDLLRMMFACCHPGILPEGRVALILKILCGFSTLEIANAFLTSEDVVSKRLYRAKEHFRKLKLQTAILEHKEEADRLDAVLCALYLLFSEGYNATDSDSLIREDLMNEAISLCKLLADNEQTAIPEVFALLALMCFSSARVDARTGVEQQIILLPKQDRSKWNGTLIDLGNWYMNRAAQGNELSAYHLEAAIAYEHCIAERFKDTNWERVLMLYDCLYTKKPTEFVYLNRMVVVLFYHGAAEVHKQLNSLPPVVLEKLEAYSLYHGLVAELSVRLANLDEARKRYLMAAQLTKSRIERKEFERMAAEL